MEESSRSTPAPALADLAGRWARARVAALRSVVPDAGAALDEPALRALAWARDPDATQRRLFDNSFRLARSFAAWTRSDLTLLDLEGALPALGAPCLRAFARLPEVAASRSQGAPCAQASPEACAAWREAIQGLVSGLASAVRVTRVRSGCTDGGCEELLHVDARLPEVFAPVPEALLPALDRALARLGRTWPEARVEVHGLREGELCVALEVGEAGCGLDPRGLMLGLLRRQLPGTPIRDVSPRPVLPT